MQGNKKWKKNKINTRFKVNKLLLDVSSNSSHFFFSSIRGFNNFKVYEFPTNFNYI